MTFPFVSIVVPAFNAEKAIKGCLSSLLATDYPSERREILLVDNASTDRTAEIIRRFPVSYLHEEKLSPPCARNRGIMASRGEIVAFTDADCIVSTRWLRELVQGFEHDDVGGVAGEILAYPPQTPAERYAARVRHLSPHRYLSRPLLPFAVFANLAFRREVFERIGLLDETMFFGESTDYCTRFLRGTGLKLHYAPRAVVFHRHRTTTRGFFRQQWNYGRGHALLYIKYRDEIPWGWRKSLLAYRALATAAWELAKCVPSYRANGDHGEEFYFCYFEFLKKVAERLGFIRESLSKGYLYF